MTDEHQADYYEVLQVSPRADGDTIERVFRHLALRLHPDNPDSGDAGRFSEVVTAYRTLSDPEARAKYDAGYGDSRRKHWKIFDQVAATHNVEADRRIRLALLTVLYQARRRDVDRPGMGIIDMEQILDSPEETMKFHLWYLKERGWIQRMDTGAFCITADGIDELNSQDIPWAGEVHRLTSGRGAPASETADPNAPATWDGAAQAADTGTSRTPSG
jgi:curved DNA-binding protein CbpA